MSRKTGRDKIEINDFYICFLGEGYCRKMWKKERRYFIRKEDYQMCIGEVDKLSIISSDDKKNINNNDLVPLEKQFYFCRCFHICFYAFVRNWFFTCRCTSLYRRIYICLHRCFKVCLHRCIYNWCLYLF